MQICFLFYLENYSLFAVSSTEAPWQRQKSIPYNGRVRKKENKSPSLDAVEIAMKTAID